MLTKRICIIPARGGSKRIPRKNIKDFCGKPIIAYSIEKALASNLFDEVMVSTDDDEIADIAQQYGAKVPFVRSVKNSDDYATTYEVIKEVLNQYEKRGQKFRTVCCIYATAPFISDKNLVDAYRLLQKKNTEAVYTVVPYSYPIQRSLYLDNSGSLRMNFIENLSARSQDLKTIYHDAGQFYIYNAQKYLEKRGVFNMSSKPIILNETEVQDIDNQSDWDIAEMKYRLKKSDEKL